MPEVVAPSRADLDITDDAAVRAVFDEVRPTIVYNCAAFHNVEVCEREEDRAFEVNARAVKRLAERCADHGARIRAPQHELRVRRRGRPTVWRGRAPEPAQHLRDFEACRRACRSGIRARCAGGPHRRSLRPARQRVQGRKLRDADDWSRSWQGALKVVADQRLTPTFTSDLAAGILAAVEADVTGTLHITNSGATSLARVHRGDHGTGRVSVPVRRSAPCASHGAADRHSTCSSPRCPSTRAGCAAWRTALADYLERAGLLAPAPSDELRTCEVNSEAP